MGTQVLIRFGPQTNHQRSQMSHFFLQGSRALPLCISQSFQLVPYTPIIEGTTLLKRWPMLAPLFMANKFFSNTSHLLHVCVALNYAAEIILLAKPIFTSSLEECFRLCLGQKKVNRTKLGTSKKTQTQVEPKLPRWHHNSTTIFRLVRDYMGLMSSPLRMFRARSILLAFAVTKLILSFTVEGWSAQPHSIT